jgi:hypothetical protein
MSIEVELRNGQTARFRDPNRPSELSNPGDPITGVVRFSYRIGEDKSLTIVKETIDAVHGLDGTWTNVNVTEKHSDVEAFYPPGEWVNVRALD